MTGYAPDGHKLFTFYYNSARNAGGTPQHANPGFLKEETRC